MLKIYKDKGYAFESGKPMTYADSYFDRYQSMEQTEIGQALNAFRSGLVSKLSKTVLDVGIGNGAFMRAFEGRGGKALGYDVCSKARAWLEGRGSWADPYEAFPDVKAVTFFDSLEHIEVPGPILAAVPAGVFAVFSLPIFDDISKVKKSKHYRPVGEGGGVEHWHYWSREGFERFLMEHGFRFLEVLEDETVIGRESVLTFVAVKV